MTAAATSRMTNARRTGDIPIRTRVSGGGRRSAVGLSAGLPRRSAKREGGFALTVIQPSHTTSPCPSATFGLSRAGHSADHGERTMSATIPVLTLLTLLSSSSATAAEQTIPATVKSGLKVSVVDDRGSSVEGHVQEVSDRVVRLSIRGGSRDIPI